MIDRRRTTSVILSAAKDLMPIASGDEVLRFSADQIRATQDDITCLTVPTTAERTAS
jgi:hypothetical protein